MADPWVRGIILFLEVQCLVRSEVACVPGYVLKSQISLKDLFVMVSEDKVSSRVVDYALFSHNVDAIQVPLKVPRMILLLALKTVIVVAVKYVVSAFAFVRRQAVRWNLQFHLLVDGLNHLLPSSLVILWVLESESDSWVC